ncbi:16S rRNA (guanine(527)-N(7))-methyltransferase RsmG [Allosphingosinicella flava]|uniref:Ribosomal RNA small subunit methyltransferase G n=1 Tax=Allosphingosinicella flava TaxID=2771430 RepID=A0A7T2LLM4_9SPHN|nr:16S rRNA (guanine(527)-N(7))-methyltransferase RsmG [Sphingosinicella flava]QPQ54533.1 16S rRNA (guanine(527)-N(7))-methyltransferase RsmG [Sphingosinicella flava]
MNGRAWVERHCNVSRETLERMEAFVALLRSENEVQNLISRATLDSIWERHIWDSAQLLRFAPDAKSWIDLGTGAGFPGLIIAALSQAKVTMVETRPKRVDFLRRAADTLALSGKTQILCAKVERVPPRRYDVISARAFAPLHTILPLGLPFSDKGTTWILPKGRNAASELEAQAGLWHGFFRVEPSLTDSDAGIIVAQGVQRAKGTRRT